MRRALCWAIAAVLLTSLLSGCATLADAQRARGTGSAKTYSVASDDIWKSLPILLTTIGLDYVGENRQEGYMLAQRGMSAFSYGENVAIFIEATGEREKLVSRSFPNAPWPQTLQRRIGLDASSERLMKSSRPIEWQERNGPTTIKPNH